MKRTADDELRRRSRHSELLHTLYAWTSRPWLVVVLVLADTVWVGLSVLAGFPDRAETIFHTVVDALTLALVFVLQHTQVREQAVTQRKLDEILRALPDAENSLITLEEGSDDELQWAALRHRIARRNAAPGVMASRRDPGPRRRRRRGRGAERLRRH